MRVVGLIFLLIATSSVAAQETQPSGPPAPAREGSHLPKFSAEPDPPGSCPEGQRLLEGECVKVPKLVKHKNPAYPEMARRAKVQTTVEMLATLLPDGTVGDVIVTKGSGIPELGFEDSALKAVKKWVYEPVLLHGKPTPVQFEVIVKFSLTD